MESQYTAQYTTPLPGGKGCLKLRQNSYKEMRNIFIVKSYFGSMYCSSMVITQFSLYFYLSIFFYEKGDRRGVDRIFLLKAQIILNLHNQNHPTKKWIGRCNEITHASR